MVSLSDADAVVIDSLRQELKNMGEFYLEGENSSVTVDPADVFGPNVDSDPSDSIFYLPVLGRFMDWGFDLSYQFRHPFPEGGDHVVTEFTPYAKLVVERLLQTWAEVDFDTYHPDDDIWISGSITDAAAAKQARETYVELYDEQPPDSYFLSIIEADEAVIQVNMYVHSGKYDSEEAFRQRCYERETALYHIDYTKPELTQLY